MDGLRLLLLLLGIVLLAGVYLAGRRVSRRRVQAAIDLAAERRGRGYGQSAPAHAGEEVDVASMPTLTAAEDRPAARGRRTRPAGRRPGPAQARSRAPAAARRDRQRALDLGDPDNAALEAPEPNIVSLGLMAREPARLEGASLRAELEAQGLRFGEMDIFHHDGVGASHRAGRAVFSVANMFEPGSFPSEDWADFSTRGIVFILPLPAPIDSKVAAELMLSTARRLAERLGAELLNARREPLVDADIDALRAEAARYGFQPLL